VVKKTAAIPAAIGIRISMIDLVAVVLFQAGGCLDWPLLPDTYLAGTSSLVPPIVIIEQNTPISVYGKSPSINSSGIPAGDAVWPVTVS
jgi:hypothetical protein